MIGDLRGPGLTLGDAAFLSEGNIAKCLKRKLSTILKPKDGLKGDFLIMYASFPKHAKMA